MVGFWIGAVAPASCGDARAPVRAARARTVTLPRLFYEEADGMQTKKPDVS